MFPGKIFFFIQGSGTILEQVILVIVLIAWKPYAIITEFTTQQFSSVSLHLSILFLIHKLICSYKHLQMIIYLTILWYKIINLMISTDLIICSYWRILLLKRASVLATCGGERIAILPVYVVSQLNTFWNVMFVAVFSQTRLCFSITGIFW